MIVTVYEGDKHKLTIDTTENSWEESQTKLNSIYIICDQEFDLEIDNFGFKNIGMDLVLTLVFSIYHTGDNLLVKMRDCGFLCKSKSK